MGVSFGLPCALAQCACNAQNALAKRHLTAPKYKARSNFRNVFLGPLKNTLRAAYQSSLVNNFADEWRVGKKVVKLAQIDRSKIVDVLKCTRAKSFVKFEVGYKIPSKARLIQGHVNEATAYEHPDEYAAFGAALKIISGHTFDDSGIAIRFVYAGGYNHDELSDLLTEARDSFGPHTLYDERDGVNWDSTMQQPTLMAEALVYEMLSMRVIEAFRARHGFCSGAIKCKLRTQARTFTRVFYTTAWKRLSGDWNTSYGNTVISMIITFVTLTELPPHLRPRKALCMFMGDDYLGVYGYTEKVCPKMLASALNHNETSMGIEPVRGIFDDPLFVHFISLSVWPKKDGGLQFVPMPARQLRKLFWAATRVLPQQQLAYRNGLCVAFWPVYYGFALMMKFLKCHYTPGITPLPMDWWNFPLSDRIRDVNWQFGFSWKYGIPYSATTFDWSPPDQAGWFESPVVDWMLAIEVLDPQDRKQCIS